MEIAHASMEILHSRFGKFIATGIAFFALGLSAQAAEKSTEAPIFGFTGPEAFPIDNFIGELRSADLDGDGLNDLIVANNAKAKINLLLNRTGKPKLEPTSSGSTRRDINELPPDARFKIESVTSEKRIAGLLVTDVNGDGKADLVYFGEPKPLELVVHYNLGKLTWSAPKRWRLEDAQLSPNALAVGDLNGDGRTDVAILGETYVSVLTQTSDHNLSEPEKVPFTGTVKGIDIDDVDGDGRADLVLLNWDSQDPIRFRLQSPLGQLGPELHFLTSPIRAFIAADLDGDKSSELITIGQTSGRAQVLNLNRKDGAKLTGSFSEGQFQVLPLPKSSKSKRGVAWADINQDQLTDLLVSHPDTGQLTVYLQQKDGSLSVSKTFPCLAGVSDIAVLPGQDGKPAEIYELSGDERQVGRTVYDEQGRIPFPTPLPLEGKPLAMAAGSLGAGKSPVLAVITETEDRRQLSVGTSAAGFRTQKLSKSFKGNPSELSFQDLDQDGSNDLLVLIPYEKMKVLVQVPGKDFEELDLASPGGSAEQPWSSTADVDADGKQELLLAQKNFLRGVALKKSPPTSGTDSNQWSLVVKDQLNGAGVNSRIVAATSLQNSGNGAAPSLFALDAERKALSVYERDSAGVWQIVRNLSLPYTEFSTLQTIHLGSTKPNTLAFVGQNAVGWMNLSGQVWELTEQDGYETPIKDGRLTNVIAGDLNHDGRQDLVFLETSHNHIDIVSYSKGKKLLPGNRWQVFEERTFRSRRGESTEPREALVVDLNGDGKLDLAIVVHDRILAYLQP